MDIEQTFNRYRMDIAQMLNKSHADRSILFRSILPMCDIRMCIHKSVFCMHVLQCSNFCKQSDLSFTVHVEARMYIPAMTWRVA